MSAYRLPEALHKLVMLIEIGGRPAGEKRHHAVVGLPIVRSRADKREAAKNAQMMGVDDESRHAQGAEIQRCRRHFSPHALQTFQADKRVLDGHGRKTVERQAPIAPGDRSERRLQVRRFGLRVGYAGYCCLNLRDGSVA